MAIATMTKVKNFSMLSVEELTSSDYEKIASDVIKLSKSKTEDEIMKSIGNGIYDMGLQTSKQKGELLEHRVNLGKAFNPMKAFTFLADTKPLKPEDAKKEGKGFFKKFKENLKNEICSNKTRQLLTSDTSKII